MIKRKTVKRLLWGSISVFMVMNLVAFFHAYKFTHFTTAHVEKTNGPEKLSVTDKLKTLFFGVSNPRPVNNKLPSQAYETIRLGSQDELECWEISTPNSIGTVMMLHGYSSCKSSMLEKSNEFLKMGYNTLLVDFKGSGGSEGSRTTIGFDEAAQVKSCYDYLKKQNNQEVYLFGSSMGAAAVLKAVKDYQLEPKGIILECPFGSLYETVSARFNIMKLPTFPMAGLLVFWGGVQNGFWPFGHKPSAYARYVNCPVLLMYGEKDEKVSRLEIDEIYANFNGKKQLKLFPLAGHDNYLIDYKNEWSEEIQLFLK